MKDTVKDTAIESYLVALKGYPQLKHPQVVELFQKLEKNQDDRPVRDRLIVCNLRLVISIAKQFKKHNLPIEDLIQEGNIGLMKAIERFDWKKGFRFSTYATWWIRQAMGQHVLKRKRTVRLPAHAASVQRKIIQTTEKFREKFDCDPTIEELMKLVDASETVIKATLYSGRGTISISQPISSSGEGDTIGDKLEDKRSDVDPFLNVSERQLIDVTMGVLDQLSTKEAAILRLRFGLVEKEPERYSITKSELETIEKGKGIS